MKARDASFHSLWEKADLKLRSESLEGEILDALIMGVENSKGKATMQWEQEMEAFLAFGRGQIWSSSKS